MGGVAAPGAGGTVGGAAQDQSVAAASGAPRPTWSSTLVLLALTALLLRGTPLAPVIYCLGLLWIAVSVLVRVVARSVAVRQHVSPTHVTPGEDVHVALTLTNRSRLPIPWMWFVEPLPIRLQSGPHFRACAALPGAGRCQVAFTLRPLQRGQYRIGTIDFTLGDWFGLCTGRGHAELPLWVTVFPRILSLPALHPPALVPLGPRRDPISPFREELTQGLRPYVSGDPQRWIAWKASARHGQLQVRDFPRVRERATTLVLDLDERGWRSNNSRMAVERAISIAASYFWSPPDGDQATGLFTRAASVRFIPEGTGVQRQPARYIHVTPRRGLLHRRRILEILATLQLGDGPELGELLTVLSRRLSPGEAVLVCTAGHSAGAWAAAGRLAAAHHPVTILGFDTQVLPPCPGARVLPVSLEGEVVWA